MTERLLGQLQTLGVIGSYEVIADPMAVVWRLETPDGSVLQYDGEEILAFAMGASLALKHFGHPLETEPPPSG